MATSVRRPAAAPGRARVRGGRCPGPGLLLGLLLAGPGAAMVAAQEPVRRPLLGRVVDRAGAPVPAARVTLVGLPAGHAGAAADVVTAAGDLRGRFRADVLQGVPYAGWAEAAPAPDGAVAVSGLLGWFGAGALPEFRCGEPRPPRRVAIAGGAAWSECGPLRWEVLATPLLAPALALRPDADGTAALPAVPADTRPSWAVRTADGGLLHIAPLPPSAGRLELPPPREVAVQALDADGAPLAGVRLAVRIGRAHDAAVDGSGTQQGWLSRPAGATGDDGRTTVLLPLEHEPFAALVRGQVLISATAAGRIGTFSGFAGQHLVRDDRRVLRGDARQLDFTLVPDVPLGGTVLAGGVPRGGCRVRLVAVAKVHNGTNSYSHDTRCYEARVGADGTYAFTGVPADLHQSQLTIVDEATGQVLARLPAEPGRGAADRRIELAAAARLRLRLLDARLGPAAGRVGYVRPVGESAPARSDLLRFAADPAGRVELLLWPGEYCVFAADDSGWCFLRTELGAGPAEREVRLEPFGRCTGVLRGDDGEPVAGARLRLCAASLRSGVAADAGVAALLAFVQDRFRATAGRYCTGADGGFDVPFLPAVEFEQRLQFVAGPRRSPEFRPAAGPPLELRLQ